MKTTALGFASVISCGIALAPLLVQTDRISAHAFEPSAVRPVTTVAISGCGDAVGWLQVNGPGSKRHAAGSECISLPGLRIADAR